MSFVDVFIKYVPGVCHCDHLSRRTRAYRALAVRGGLVPRRGGSFSQGLSQGIPRMG